MAGSRKKKELAPGSSFVWALAHYNIRVVADQFLLNKRIPLIGNLAVKGTLAVCSVEMGDFTGSVQTHYISTIDCCPPAHVAEMTARAVKRTHPVM
jgi:hypothetical protein